MKQIFFLLIMLGNTLLAGGAKHALVFGLGKYQDSSWGKIHGDNDVYYVRQMLDVCGYTDIVTLKNEQATKQAMVRAFINLANRCKKGDHVYIHYSGHGQLMTDLDGDEALRTTARHGQWDESWVPYDGYMRYGQKDHGEKHLCDDEVEFYLSSIRDRIGKNGQMIVVIDACHSGDATRGEEEECVRGVDVKFNIPKSVGGTTSAHKSERWLTVSACKPYQLATELKDHNVGKLTFAIYSLGKRFFTISKDELQKSFDSYMEMNKGRLPQNPMVSGAK